MYELRSAIAWSFWWISTALPSRLAARIREQNPEPAHRRNAVAASPASPRRPRRV